MKCLGMSFYSKWMHPSKDCLQTFDALMARFETRRSFSGLYGKQAPAGPPHPSDRVPFDQGGGQQDAFGQRFVAPHPGGHNAHFDGWNVDGGQGRIGVLAHFNAAHADNGHLIRHPDAQLVQRALAAMAIRSLAAEKAVGSPAVR